MPFFTVVLASIVGVSASANVAIEPEMHCGAFVAPNAAISVAEESTVCFTSADDLEGFMDGRESAGVQAAAVPVAVLYEHAGYGGATFTLYASGPCAGASYGFASLGGGWDSRVSSARGLNGCSLALYTATNYGGTMWNCGTGCSALPGLLNDKVRSVIAR